MSKPLTSIRRSTNMKESLGVGEGPPPDVVSPASFRLVGFSRNPDAGMVRVDDLESDPDQPRKDFDDEYLSRLGASLLEQGVLQPIVIRPHEEQGRWYIVAGECRWRAAKQVGIAEIPCIRRETADEIDVKTIQLIENCVRQDLNDVEKAQAYRALMEKRGWNQTELGRQIHVSQGHVSKVLTIMKADGNIKEKVVSGELAPRLAYEQQVLAKAESEGRPRRSRMTTKTFAVRIDRYEVVFEGKVRATDVPDSIFERAFIDLAATFKRK